MTAYVIAQVDVHDPEPYEEYRTEVLPTLGPFQGRFIVRGGAMEVLEGDWAPQRTVIIEFPTAEQARDWYASPAYQRILPIRLQHAHSHLFLVEGV